MRPLGVEEKGENVSYGDYYIVVACTNPKCIKGTVLGKGFRIPCDVCGGTGHIKKATTRSEARKKNRK